MLSFSVVINTCNRAQSLDETLRSLHRQSHTNFEVIVVNGPSVDGTEEVLARHQAFIRAGFCEKRNISVSRNVGIRMAGGDVVAFIDDDAIPDEDWLQEIEKCYTSDEVGGAGGFVYDHTGYKFQTQYLVCDRVAEADDRTEPLSSQLCFPGTLEYPHLLGTNATYRRSALLDVGGFDEEYEYFLDETDLCLRLIDAGYTLEINPRAVVYHRFLPSHIRSSARVPTNYYPIFKNKWYFSFRHAADYFSEQEIQKKVEDFVTAQRNTLLYCVGQKMVASTAVFECDRIRALAEVDGKDRAKNYPPKLIDEPLAVASRGKTVVDAENPDVIKAHPFTPRDERLNICLLSQQYPPGIVGGVGRMVKEMAHGLAARGHRVRVLTRSTAGTTTVDWEDGVWVHRVAPATEAVPPPGSTRIGHLWSYSRAILAELERIRTQHPVDVVDAPVWDGEAWAILADGTFRTVTSLETPLKVVVRTNPQWRHNAELAPLFEEQSAVEAYVVAHATAVRALTHGVVREFEHLYNISIDREKLNVVPLGIDDASAWVSPRRKADGFMDVLFAGRLEPRKGIDVLLGIVPELCRKYNRLRFIITGEDHGSAVRDAFLSQHSRANWLGRVRFSGPVPDEELQVQFAECDIFVAPSRFESFGIVFLEAMAFGRPVVGCKAGGMPEVIEDGVTGLLAEPGDPVTLKRQLERLVMSEQLRAELGAAGRRRFEQRFLRDQMILNTEKVYRSVVSSCALSA